MMKNAPLKMLPVLLLLLSLAACERQKTDSSHETDGDTEFTEPERTKIVSNDTEEEKGGSAGEDGSASNDGFFHLPEINSQRVLDDLRKEDERLNAQLRRLQALSSGQVVPDFDEALDLAYVSVFANVFIVRREEDGRTKVIRNIQGRLPDDAILYLPNGTSSGSYLVGVLIPRGGYDIYEDRLEKRFCVRLTDDEKFIQEKDGNGMDITEVEQRVKGTYTGDEPLLPLGK
ncbi:hypothetical protein NT6N_05660 [Oceaniferula spumae]|uniref:Lipoprotein n=1 Tax=Oceaniferula spumae TaxID=2979115 RepID=A0AAT9FHP7_9BACT